MADVKINVQVITAAAQAAVKNLNTLVGVTSKGFDNLTKDVNGVSKALTNVSKAGTNITKGLNDIAKGVGNTFAKFLVADLASAAIRRLTSGVIDLVKSSVEISIQLEKAAARFQAFTGSVASANKFVKELAELEDQTPFQFEQIANAAQTLLSFGRSVNQTKSDLIGLADVATASGANIEELATIFGKAASVGAVTGRELNGLQANGIPIIAELGKQLNLSSDSVKKFANEGKISFAQFEQAFQSLSKEGGFAFQAIQRQSETLGGRIKTLGDAFEQLQINVGQQLGPALKAIITTFTAVVNSITSFVTSTSGAAQISNFLITTLKVLANTGLFLYNAFNGIVAVVNSVLGTLTGFGGTIVSIVTGPMRLFLNTLVAVAEALGFSDTKIHTLRNGLETINDFLPTVSETFYETFEATGTAMAGASLAVDEFGNSLDANLRKEQENAKLATEAEKKKTSDLKVELDKQTANVSEAQQKALQEKLAFNEAELAIKQSQDEAIFQQQLTSDATFDEQDQLALDAFKFAQEQKLTLVQISNANMLGEKTKAAQLEAKLIQDQSKFEIDTAKKVADLKEKQRQQDLKEQQSFFDTAISLSNSENRTLLAIGRAAALAQLAIKTPEAVGNSYAFGTKTGGPILGSIFAGIASVAMAAQAAQIVGAKFENGGIVGGNSFSGDKVPAQVNSGEMILNRQQQAQLFQQANGQSGGGQMTQINTTVMLDSEVVARAVSKHVADGFKLGEVF